MIRVILSALLVSLLLNSIKANPVDSIVAKRAANNFYYQNSELKSLTGVNAKLVYISTASENENLKLYYVFNINNDDGFVVVSADNDVNPVIAYTLKGRFSSENLPPDFIYWMRNYENQILYVKQNLIKADKKISDKWKYCLTENNVNIKDNKKKAGPLLTSKWGQGCYYNSLCPVDTQSPFGYCNRVPSGCVATAVAQILRYWNFPAHGFGFHIDSDIKYGELIASFANTNYEWSNMPDILTKSSTPEQINAVGTLIKHCGISINTDYEANGSGVATIDFVGDAMRKYFNYSNSMKIQKVKWNINWTEWKAMLINEIDSKRPVLYSGSDDYSKGGHGWICDGYNDNEYFHFNWGWDGGLDGYYAIDNLNPGGLSFNSTQIILTGIQPNPFPDSRLNLYSDIKITPDTISYGNNFKLNVNIINNDTTVFIGRFAAFLFNKSDKYILIDSTIKNDTINPGSYLKNGISFFPKDIFAATPGEYKAGIYFCQKNGNWTLADTIYFKNLKKLIISDHPDNLHLASEISVSPDRITQNQSFVLKTKIINKRRAFKGDASFILYNENGDSLQTLWTKYNISIDSLKSDSLFSSDLNINVQAGKYLIAVSDKKQDSKYEFVSSGSYSNPIFVLVLPKPLQPDKYERNEIETKSYSFNVIFNSDSADVVTSDANIDNNIDLDFYKINLPKGYAYKIIVTAFDKDKSFGSNTFSTNILFSYKDSTKWSNYYDDKQPAKIKLSNGGIVYFQVFAFNWGETGTYQLDVIIKRFTNESVQSINGVYNYLKVYPDPADNLLNIDISNIKSNNANLRIYDNYGKLISNTCLKILPANIDISSLINGIYNLEMIVNDRIYHRKIIVIR